MFKMRMKQLTLGLSASVALMCSDARATTINIKVAVASSFGNAASDLASAFQAYYGAYGLTYTISLSIASAQTLEADIIGGGAFDLFLSSSKKEPKDLADNYPSLVVGTPFKYAKDFLALYSKSVDIGAGLPYPLTTDFVIPDPTKDVYGEAAAEVLSSYPWYIDPATFPSGHAFTKRNVGASFAAVDIGLYSYGFLAKSQICFNGASGQTFPAGSYHHIYKPNNEDHPSEKLVLKGIKIAHTRTTDQETELSNFVAFLTGGVDSNSNTTLIGKNVIEGYCFKSF